MLSTRLLHLYAWLLAAQVALSSACNNSPELCNRSYGNITYLGAHDSPFVRNASNGYTVSGNQFYNTIEQLSSGVRLVTSQLHRSGSDLRLCHSNCAFYDAGLLSDWLASIGSWLDGNPNDVVTVLLVNADDAKADELARVYEAANVVRYAYTPSSNSSTTSWPTLQSLIDANTRLLSFVATMDDNTAAPYLMDEFTYVFENSYSNLVPSDFSCQPDRPTDLRGNLDAALSSGRLPLQNHFLYEELGLGIRIPDVGNVSNTNAPEGSPGNLGDSAAQCASLYARAPGFLLLDFVNVGNPLVVVDRLNGVSGATGRTALPTETPSTAPVASQTATSILTSQATSSLTSTPTTAQTSVPPGQSSTESAVPTSSSAATTTGSQLWSLSGEQMLMALSVIFGLRLY